MNCEQLQEINKLVDKLESGKRFFNSNENYYNFQIRANKTDGVYVKVVAVDWERIEPMLAAYREELVKKLKELGYEDEC
jgi:hypothetical protein